MRLNNKNVGQGKYKTMIVDDDPGIIDTVKVILDSSKYSVFGYTDPFEAIKKIQGEHFDLLILDFLLEQTTGEKVIEYIRKFNRELYILLLTGYKDMAAPLESLQSLDIQGYCEKGDRLDQLSVLVESAIKSINFSRRSFNDGMKSVLASVPEMYRLRPMNILIKDVFQQFLQVTESENGFIIISTKNSIRNKKYIKLVEGSGSFNKPFEELYQTIIDAYVLDIETLFEKNNIIFSENIVFFPLVSESHDEFIAIGVECNVSDDMKDFLKVFHANAESSYNNAILHNNNINKKNNDLSLMMHKLETKDEKQNRMRIAIFEDDKTLRLDLARLLGYKWDVEFFQNPVDLGETRLNEYDIIISDYYLTSKDNRELLEKIAADSDAELLIIGNEFTQENIDNERIKGLIDRNNISSIVDNVRFIGAKTNIQSLVEESTKELEEIKDILVK